MVIKDLKKRQQRSEQGKVLDPMKDDIFDDDDDDDQEIDYDDDDDQEIDGDEVLDKNLIRIIRKRYPKNNLLRWVKLKGKRSTP